MGKKIGKILFITLAVMLLLTVVGLSSAFAETYTEGYYTYSVENGESTIADVDEGISGDITIPATLGGYPVTSIGEPAFIDCQYIESIQLPKSLKNIAPWAFAGCLNLKRITIPNSVTNIGSWAFAGCISLESIIIPDAVTNIPEYTFSLCLNLNSITLPASITYIEENAFDDCENLEDVYYAGTKTQWQKIDIDSYNDYLTSATIHYNHCDHDFESVVTEPTCTTDGYTLHTCNVCGYSYKDAYVYSNGHLDENNDNICEVCGNNVSDILVGETKLIEIIADEITYLRFIPERSGEYTFYSSADSDTYGYLFDADKNQLAYNDDGGENNNFSITYELEAGTEYYWGARFYSTSRSGSFNVTLECSHSDADFDGICDNCGEASIVASGTCGDNLTWVIYGDTLVISGTGEMDDYAYYGVPWYAYNNYIRSAIIENGVVSIGDYAFYRCDSLASITIPESVTNISNKAFAYCLSLENITVEENNNYYSSDAYGVLFNKSKTELIQYPRGISGNSYSIPESVTSIGSYAVFGCESLVSITIPESVTSIGDYAFSDCDSLTSITIPESVTSIGNSAFNDCDSLTSITIPESVTSIGYSVFGYCTGLTSITISESVTSIGDYAFERCTGLTSITIPESVTSIGSYVFMDCDSLASISVEENNNYYSSDAYGVLFNKNKTELIQYPIGNSRNSYSIPESVSGIGSYAFMDCDSLTSITIPESVTDIREGAFIDCDSLANITIPESVTSIGDYVFEGCIGLTIITIPESVTSIGSNALNDCDSLESITILNPECEIYNSSYTIASVVTIVGYPGSTAQAYAERYDRTFEVLCDHDFESIINEPTCTTDGCVIYTCNECGDTYTETTAKLGHKYSSSYTVDKKATCATTGSKSKHCTRNGCTAKTSVTTIAKLAHTYDNACDKTCNVCSATRTITHSYTTTTTKATLSKSGSIKTACTVCGNVKSNKTISYPKTFTLSATSYTYNGYVKTPTVTVKDANGNVLTKGTDYTVTYAEGRKNVGTYKVTVKMTGNYTGTKTLTFKINPIDISSCTVKLSATSLTYNGNVRTPTVTVTNASGTKLTKGTSYTVTYAEGRKNVGTYKVTVKMIGNYTGTKTLTFKINPINISTCTVKLSATSLTYNGAVRTPTVTVTNSYGTKLTKDKHYTITYAEGRKNVGTYKVTVKMIGNYTGSKTLTFKINPIKISTCTVKLSATSLTYNGAVRTPTVTVTNSYGTKLTKDKHYTVTYATGRKNAGTYNVTVKMFGNYTGTKTLSFKINPINISTCKVKLSATSLTYNGNVRTPVVTVTNSYGTKLTKDKHYTVTYSTGRKNVGTYKVTVKMIGNYTGTKTLSFKINPINISKCTVNLSATSYTYDGNVKAPTVTVKNASGTKLTKGTSYTVTYTSGRKNVGTYKVTVTMKGNYTGTKTLTFKINPPKTTIASLKAGTKSITVNLNKKTTQTTGYQIQYSTNKDFTNAKTKTLTSNSTVKTTLSSLTAGKTYYVRVRTYKTVNDVKYYSGWSVYKYVKTK